LTPLSRHTRSNPAMTCSTTATRASAATGQRRRIEARPSIELEAKPSVLNKTKLCRFFAKGHCTRGAHCTYAHDAGQLQLKPDLTCTKLCPLKARCTDPACKFAHRQGELRRLDRSARCRVDSSPTSSTTSHGSSCRRDASSDADTAVESVWSDDESIASLFGLTATSPEPQSSMTGERSSGAVVTCRVRHTFLQFELTMPGTAVRRSRSWH